MPKAGNRNSLCIGQTFAHEKQEMTIPFVFRGGVQLGSTFPRLTGAYSRPLRTAAITRGLRRPWNTATTHSGFSAGA
jgi:hypothetical protein